MIPGVILSNRGLNFLKKSQVKPVDLLNFFGTPKEKLLSTDGITNILLLGIRGEGSDSPNLSDTIIIFSYDHENRRPPAIISVPRDLYIPSAQAKINSAYHYGEEASPGAGIIKAQGAIQEIIGLPIHYTAVVNFSLFRDIIDSFGGLDVNNEIAFTDNEFPIPGKETALPISSRYETISFSAGLIHLDGEQALKYVRSRHSQGETGTDFSRSKRQQSVISALRSKIISPDFLLNENRVNSLIDLVNRKLITNIPPSIYPAFAKLALDTKEKQIKNISISDRPDSKGVTILYHPPLYKYRGEWVLIPKDNNWKALKQYVQQELGSTTAQP